MENWKVISGAVHREKDNAPIATMVRTEEASAAGIYPVERDENAKLIAAAPELLEACRYALGTLGDTQGDMSAEEHEARRELEAAKKPREHQTA